MASFGSKRPIASANSFLKQKQCLNIALPDQGDIVPVIGTFIGSSGSTERNRAKMNISKSKRTVSMLMIGLGLAVHGYSQSFLTNGLVAYYPLNGNANDASGNGNNAYMSGTVSTANRFGQPNAALYFNRTNSLVTTPGAFLDIGADYTLSIWFCTFDSSAQFQTLVGSTPNPAIDFAYNVAIWGGDLHLDLSIGNGTDWLQPTQQHGPKQDYMANQWYHVVATKSGSSYSTFVNGVPDASFGRSPGHLLIQLLIGAQFLGVLDDVRIYNRALSAAEVQQLYAIESTPLPRPYLNVAISLSVSKQNSANVIGAVATTAPPTRFTLTTRSILNVLAMDEYAAGNWPSNSFPKDATLALAGNSFVVLSGTNILLNVSDIMSFDTGETKVTSGKENTVTGLANPTAQKLQIAGIAFDDTFINGGNRLKFYLQGVLSKTTTDTAPVNGAYTETQKLKIATAAGDGSSQDVPFICTGYVSATGKSPLHL